MLSLCMSEVDSFRCVCFHFLTLYEQLSVTYRQWVFVSKNRIITKKKKFTSTLLGATSPFVHTAIFLAISEAWIKYVKITLFWDVMPPSSQCKMPLPLWRWRQQIPQKTQYHFTKLNGVTFEGTVISTVGAARAQMSSFLNCLQSPCQVSHS